MEIAYWNAETGQLDSARILTSAAARLLSRADIVASAAKSSDRVALRSVLAGLDNTHFAFLEARYFPDLGRIPGGGFMMGSPDSIGEEDEHPQHRVQLSAFQLARTETTFWQFAVYTENNKLDIQTFAPTWGFGGRDPIVNVSWYDAARYANWLSAREGRKPAYVFEGEYFQDIDQTANGYRLPTEAQWEYAARSGGKDEVYAGLSEEQDLYKYANYDNKNDGYKYTSPAGHYKPNGLGLFDMSGNVLEWCQDSFGSYQPEEQTDPVGADKGGFRVYRGGGWNYGARFCRAANRNPGTPGTRINNLGFRLARSF